MKYYISNSLSHTSIDNINYVFNWDLGDYIEFDKPHDFLDCIFQKTKFYESENIDDIEFLLDNKYIFKDENDYISMRKQLFLEEQERLSRSISLIILPAGQACNFACTYCYEDHTIKHKMGNIEEDAIAKFIKNECSQRQVDYVSISYFGGEPLVNKEFIINLNKTVKSLSKEYSFTFSSSMTTNGYFLNPEIVSTLEDINLNSYQITVDGLKEEHDQLRPLINGNGTYDKIINNLINIKASDSDVLLDIRVNFNKKHESSSYKDKLIESFHNKFGNDSRFRIRFRPIGDYASLNDRTVDQDIICGKTSANDSQFAFESLAIEKGIPLADINMFAGVGTYSCYASKPNNYVIDSFLNIKKCTVALDKKINDIGRLSIDGNLALNQNNTLWLEKNSKNECSSCHFHTQCNSSSCPLINLQTGTAKCPPVAYMKDKWSKRLINFIKDE